MEEALLTDSSLVWLLLKHFPKWLSIQDKESLLEHFGAAEVKAMPASEKMRNCVFAAFTSKMDATQALRKLHQLEVFGNRLVVEFASAAQLVQLQQSGRDRWLCNKSPWKDEDELELVSSAAGDEEVKTGVKEEPSESMATAKHSRCQDESPPLEEGARYLYPPASPATLTNIVQALLTMPDFYTQVLHVMNKMNLPPPFNHPPPLPAPLGIIVVPGPCQHQQQQQQMQQEEGGAEWEESGSELESDGEEKSRKRKRKRVLEPARRSPKRRKVSYKQVKSLQASLKRAAAGANPVESHDSISLVQSRSRIELKVPSELAPVGPEDTPGSVHYIESISTVRPSPEAVEKTAGHLDQPPTDSMSPTLEHQFISQEELASGRLTQREMDDAHVYRKYSPGEPSTRLYVKNLAKQVEVKDLHYIFGRYCNWSDDAEASMFDIRLMQTGRMKGQAFVSLPDDKATSKALQETNGFVLHGKPMVVHFARSTKPRHQDT